MKRKVRLKVYFWFLKSFHLNIQLQVRICFSWDLTFNIKSKFTIWYLKIANTSTKYSHSNNNNKYLSTSFTWSFFQIQTKYRPNKSIHLPALFKNRRWHLLTWSIRPFTSISAEKIIRGPIFLRFFIVVDNDWTGRELAAVGLTRTSAGR